jgi:putative tryptophan/tyrosine transport system substrate-binding protein
MQRREFIRLLGGAAAAWPLAAHAQQPAIPVIGFLHGASPGPFTRLVAAFRDGLKDNGYVEGHDVTIEFRWAEGQYGRLPALATDLVDRHVSVIAAIGPAASLAAKAATTTVPVVFTTNDDPVKLGLVASLNRPGGNITGINVFTGVMEGKRLGFLTEMLPRVTLIAVLVNPTNLQTEASAKEIQTAAAAIGRQVIILNANNERDIDVAFAAIMERRAGALLVGNDIFFNSRRDQIVDLAARNKLPAIYEFREFVDAGGLMSYGTNLTDIYRQAGNYVGKILKGTKPTELPVMQSTKFELVINLKTAKALGLTLPSGLLSIVDDVIE